MASSEAKTHYLLDVDFVLNELDAIYSEAEQQVMELQAFKEGRRKSIHPLGKKFLLNIGTRLDEIKREIEFRLSDMSAH